MAYFRDAQEVYETVGRLFVEITADDELGPCSGRPTRSCATSTRAPTP